jgi:alkylation response protein AidB-like acyl-CoA dehydrogenase
MSDFTPEEQLLLERAREFAQLRVAPHAARWACERTSCIELFALAASLGLLGLQVPRSLGGSAMSFACKVQVAEILAAADFGVAMSLINTHNVAEQMARLGPSSLVQRFVPGLIAGQISACTALTEPLAGSDFSAIQTRATAVPGGWQLDGSKTWITNAVHADVLVVYAQTQPGAGAAGIAAFVVDAHREGFQREPGPPIGPLASMGTGEFRLEGYLCKADELLSPAGEAFKDILRAINGARSYVAGMCCGMVGECLRVASTFGLQRKTFGKPLLAHQGWRWQLADAAIDLEAAQLMVRHSASLVDAAMDAQSACAKAKVFATRIAQQHIAALMQAMGAEGLREKYPFQRHLAASQLAGLVDGSTEMLLERIAKDFKAS